MGGSFDDGLRIGALVGGRFEIVDLIAAGGMGRVYRARQRSFGEAGRLVALKVLKPTARDGPAWRRFELEAAAASRLTSPHTVTVHDFGRTDRGMPYLVMELVDGPSLDVVVAREAPLPAGRAVAIVTQVLRGLAEAHAAGILHRDVKPANILLARDASGEERALLADFGIAKDLTEAAGRITDDTGGVGTWLYASPEQIEGSAVDARTDLYAAGLVLYELLTGYPPFRKTSLGALLNSHLNEVPPGVDDVYPQTDAPAEVVSIVRTALAKDPERRPASATDMRRALEAAMIQTFGTLPGFDVRSSTTLRRPDAPARRSPTSPDRDPRTRIVSSPPETGEAPDITPARRQRSWLPVVATLAIAVCLGVAGLGLYSVLSTPPAAAPAPAASAPATVEAPAPAAVFRPDLRRRDAEGVGAREPRALERRVPLFASTRTETAEAAPLDRRDIATTFARPRPVRVRKPARPVATQKPEQAPAKPVAKPPVEPTPRPGPVIYVPD